MSLKKYLGKSYSKFIPARFKFPSLFWTYYRFLLKSQWWSAEEFRNYQWTQLSDILDIAFKNIRFYKDYYAGAGIKRSDIQKLEDLAILPVIDKNMVNENREIMINSDFPKEQLVYATTGGSTAEPVGFYREKFRTKQIEHAFAQRKNTWFGYKPVKPRIVLEAKVEDSGTGNTYSLNYRDNTLVISYPDLDSDNIGELKKNIERFKPWWIHGYPSALYIFSKKVQSAGISFYNLKGISSSSETLYQFQREFIEKIFRKRLFDHYGMSEMVIMATECPAHDGLHISPEYGIIELIKHKTNKTDLSDGCKIIGTGLQNPAMPLIRYDVGDQANWKTGLCRCGRNMPRLEKIEGRVQDLLVTGTKRLISMTSINMHNNLFDNVQQYQFYQQKAGYAIIKIIPLKSYSAQNTGKILNSLGNLIGEDMKLEIQLVDDIPLTRLGKHRFLNQELNIADFLN